MLVSAAVKREYGRRRIGTDRRIALFTKMGFNVLNEIEDPSKSGFLSAEVAVYRTKPWVSKNLATHWR